MASSSPQGASSWKTSMNQCHMYIIIRIFSNLPSARLTSLHRISGKALDHASHILAHLKLEHAGLMASSFLMEFLRPSHPDQELENITKHTPNISQYSSTSCSFQGPPSSFINDLMSAEGFAEYHLLDCSSISGRNYLSIVSAMNLLSNQVTRKAERFIRAFHPAYINLIKGITPTSAEHLEESSYSIIDEHISQ